MIWTDERDEKILLRGLRKEFLDTDLVNQSVFLNLLLVKDFDRNRFLSFSVSCKPDLCKGAFPDSPSKLILPNTALHLW
jgi:hypothetical protein